MLDKNHKQKIFDHIQKKPFNLIFTQQPFLKQVFLQKLTTIEIPIIYLDFDLLYSGYQKMGLIKKNQNLQLYQIYPENLQKKIIETIQIISKKRTLVILDSLNGFYNLYDDINVGRKINAYLMLLYTFAEQSNSIIICSCIAKQKENELILVPLNRHVWHSEKMNVINLKKINDDISLNFLDDDLLLKETIMV